ncbi:MAG TPA: hypothetical protein VFE50_15055 [Cyclobacteriaceae bacterium]|nr:hypothetical protein [Cyclobacteriaceae bacterium]
MTDPFFTWIVDYSATLAVCIIVILITVWLTSKVYQYNNRLIKVENDMKIVKKRLSRLEGNMLRLEKKLDLLISHLITTKQVDKDVLG